jgi:hypothetical protein
MITPKTADEWWENASQPVIMDVISRFVPVGRQACRDIGAPATPENRIAGTTIRDDILRCLKSRDLKMLDYCQAAWCLAPDVPGLHEIPGWDDLCNLCSEGWLLQDEPPEDACEDLADVDQLLDLNPALWAEQQKEKET